MFPWKIHIFHRFFAPSVILMINTHILTRNYVLIVNFNPNKNIFSLFVAQNFTIYSLHDQHILKTEILTLNCDTQHKGMCSKIWWCGIL